jgi:hypothetical protein
MPPRLNERLAAKENAQIERIIAMSAADEVTAPSKFATPSRKRQTANSGVEPMDQQPF